MIQNLDMPTLFLTPDSNVFKKLNPDPHIMNRSAILFISVSISIPLTETVLSRGCVIICNAVFPFLVPGQLQARSIPS
jgi:hypothetical protein